MKRNKRLGLFCSIFIFCAGLPAFSQVQIPELGELQSAMDGFSESMANSLPFNSAMGLNWSHAHIGKLPSFGVGVSLGFTTVESEVLELLLSQFSANLPIDALSAFPLMAYTVEGRVGGFAGLPFDIGAKLGVLPLNISSRNAKIDYLLFGFDFRYAVLQETAVRPGISVGVGFNRLSGGIETKIGRDRRFNYPNPSTEDLTRTGTITLEAPAVGVNWESNTLDFKAQISKSAGPVTPYLGLGAANGWSKAGYDVISRITDSEGGDNLDNIIRIAKEFGIADLSQTGFSSLQSFSGWSFRTFGGVSFNISAITLDLTGLYNFNDNNYGISLGGRLQFGR